MENSSRFYENDKCQYYPCHKDVKDLNCLFCYCPLYSFPECPGQYKYIDSNGKKVKECTDCTFPHEAKNYDSIIALLSENSIS